MSERVATLEKLTGVPIVKLASTSDKKDVKDSVHTAFLKQRYGDDVTRSVVEGRSYKVTIVEKLSATSAANTALTTVSGLAPLNTTEGKAFATLFDICRCTAITCRTHWRTASSTDVPTGPVLHCDAAYTYDPSNSTAYGSVVGVLESSNAVGPIHLSGYGGISGGPQVINRMAFDKHWVVPKLVDPGILTDLLDGNWVTASDTAVVVGYIKMYAEPGGAAVKTGLDHYVYYHMEYRTRT